ncbi:ABC transporter permease (plasmid) [Rhizobium laguerreae]|uniref:ABC transporter permease n=1 Tax=Rhizobium laguerreae TaxID=1076926 RepID=UPI001E3CC731|nr:ABC transporter permease [Rhizobium laguerreae]UFW68244.1 ABC transporter permease [Rhizobium laguerreae]
MKNNVASDFAYTDRGEARKWRPPQELSIFFVLIGIALIYEVLGWIFVGQSFLANPQRLTIAILQVSVVGIIAIGVTQVIITGGIDLSAGSLVAMTAMISASLAQTSDWARALYPALTDMPAVAPIGIGVLLGLAAGLINGAFIAYAGIPPFIATLGMMVSARGISKWYTKGQPISGLSEQFTFIGSGAWPVIVFILITVIFHVVLRYTRYGKFTYAIGANAQAARVSGINIEKHLLKVYAIAGMLAGLAGVVTAARAQTAQSGMGANYELDAIAATVIGGTSLAGGTGRITGTVIGVIILGVMSSGFTFLRIDAYYQEIVKGVIIVAAVTTDVYRNRKRRKA